MPAPGKLHLDPHIFSKYACQTESPQHHGAFRSPDSILAFAGNAAALKRIIAMFAFAQPSQRICGRGQIGVHNLYSLEETSRTTNQRYGKVYRYIPQSLLFSQDFTPGVLGPGAYSNQPFNGPPGLRTGSNLRLCPQSNHERCVGDDNFFKCSRPGLVVPHGLYAMTVLRHY
ncbi:hypothetical protein MJO28_016551 [Puccinia striiformis f. sp. tritici]|uniref:Uncharacterized protein n=1 Tax=Puccinia striiformis f. sp. tritici TaxID=168172 RepID=A0ACC0DNJ0_9BASI|nr:hypothetical protein MJO28_016551 [Puccinia striiformis f. sp. tritici]KAI9599952.1 hypothetical protein KEM48_000064 [Puccinia striiformis f. sp. tritici PST-130]